MAKKMFVSSGIRAIDFFNAGKMGKRGLSLKELFPSTGMAAITKEVAAHEEKFCIHAASFGFNEVQIQIIKEYMRYLAMTSLDSYSCCLDREGAYLLRGLLSNDKYFLETVGLILPESEDPFQRMQEIVSEFNDRKAGA